MRTKSDRKINKIAKEMNRVLAEDVFGDRFYFQQVCKQRTPVAQYYLYEIRDRVQTDRRAYLDWVRVDSPFVEAAFYELANDFIIRSNFWSLYFNDEDRYDEEADEYKKGGRVIWP